MFKDARILSILTVFIFILSACNFPSSTATTPTAESNAVFTAAALTVQAQLTQSVPFSTPTLPISVATNTALSVPTLPVSTLPAFSATPVCDQAQFVKDITIPDGSQITPGATFTKTWRLRNAGACSWSGYSLIFDSGDLMGATSPQTIGSVPSGGEVDLSVNFTAPISSGSYRSYWRIKNSSGVFVPVLGGTDGKSFFVDIKVSVASSGFDLHTRATDANWVSGASTLTFGGPDTNVNGFAMYRNNQKLEDNSSPAKVLETHPQWVTDGAITGTYPAYKVVPGEHFKTRIGFLLLSDGTCGSGNVKFQLNYKEGSASNSLGQWTESCDGTLRDVDVDLNGIAGRTVQFVLAVVANGSATQDQAIWVSPRVEIP